jgi:hypothetical protein
MASAGPLVVLDAIGSESDELGVSIVQVDVQRGTWSVLAKAAPGYHPWTPVVSDDWVVWVEWRYKNSWFSGSASWRIVARNQTTGATTVVASGVSTRLAGGAADEPPIALEGNLLAYATEAPTAAHPWGWRVHLLDLGSRKEVGAFITDEQIYGFGLSHGMVAYSEGLVDPNLGFVYKTRLMLATGTPWTSREIARDAFELSFKDGRLAWVADPFSSQHQSGLERTARVWTAVAPSWTPNPVIAGEPPATDREQWPAADSALVTFDRSDILDSSGGIGTLWLWDADSSSATKLSGTEGAIISSLSEGWVTWAGGLGDAVTVSGLPIAALTR